MNDKIPAPNEHRVVLPQEATDRLDRARKRMDHLSPSATYAETIVAIIEQSDLDALELRTPNYNGGDS